jgi:hypothetical protein
MKEKEEIATTLREVDKIDKCDVERKSNNYSVKNQL